MDSGLADERFFERMAAEDAAGGSRAPSRLKSRIYSALVRRQQESGPLLSLSKTKTTGRALCVFEKLVQIAPVPETMQSPNFCRVCHARMLAEAVENAPIYWRGCPYVEFQKR
jgi:hypothetical protein